MFKWKNNAGLAEDEESPPRIPNRTDSMYRTRKLNGVHSIAHSPSISVSTLSDLDLQSPVPSHQRNRSLDDVIFSDDIPTLSAYGGAMPVLGGGSAVPSLHKREYSIGSLRATNEQLQKALEFEEMETQRLERELKESKAKVEERLSEQSKLEQDLFERNNLIAQLQKQLKDMRRMKQEVENALSEEQMQYINEKQQWLDRESEMENKIRSLSADKPLPVPSKPSFEEADDVLSAIAVHSVDGDKEKVPPLPPKRIPTAKEQATALDKMKNELDLCRQQLELVSREYALRHEKLRQELEQTNEVNSRLKEENEQFQVLLAQKTVLGDFSSLAEELDQIYQEEDLHDDNDTTNDNNDDDDISKNSDTTDETDVSDDNENPQENASEKKKDNEKKKKDMKTRLYELEFETKSLTNHNKALKVSLERLVQRLLEFRDFEKVVEDQNSVTSRSISLFHRRVSSSSTSSAPLIGGHRHYYKPQRRISPSVGGAGGHLPLDVPKHRRNSPSQATVATNQTTTTLEPPTYYNFGSPTSSPSQSFFHFPGAANGIGVMRSVNRALRPPSTWSSMIFQAPLAPHDGINSPQSSTTATAPTPGSNNSSASSITSQNSSDFTSIIDGNAYRPPCINGQKKLRPLKLTSSDLEPVPPSPASSTWSFGIH
ncbi:hypothetical protein TRVA0_001S03906 [Trichomonascus vanleenenianus]|uniref:uncharacterized protein n=1 Tax=Trichomonascus vanleenenianus TaxID=2268995 RepID=UPI003ECA4B45